MVDTLRFEFGKNWSSFLRNVDENCINEAIKSIQIYLDVDNLEGKTFLDIGSGSGLFSLAAYKLGARVFSFDYDIDSVKCTQYLKEKFASQDDKWLVEQGSALDRSYLQKYKDIDIVYSWGVLHHTGDMMSAFENVSSCVKDGGKLFISIYNDQGGASKRWLWVKKKYCKGGPVVRLALSLYTLFRQWTLTFVKDFLKTGNFLTSWKTYGDSSRGMSAWIDVVDWVGGYPFEVAKPEVVFDFFKRKNFNLLRLKTCAGGLGCNEFVFEKNK